MTTPDAAALAAQAATDAAAATAALAAAAAASKPLVPTAASPAVAFTSTGDAALDMAMGFFAKHGVAQGDLAMTSAAAGDFSVLNAVLQEKGAEGATAYVAIAQQAHSRRAEADKAKGAARDTAIHTVMGGAENWIAVKEFVGQQATAEELAEINTSLNSGGFQAKATALYLRQVYEKANGGDLFAAGARVALPDPTAAATTRASSAAAAPTAMSPEAYKQAVKDLVIQYGAGAYGRPEYAAAAAARKAWRG